MNIAIITARGGSKRIPHKNIKKFCDRPIIEYSIQAAKEADIFDTIMVSTDDEEIARIAKSAGAEVPFMRSEDTSNDYATTADVLKEVLKRYSELGMTYENVCCIYPTAPFVTGEKRQCDACNVILISTTAGNGDKRWNFKLQMGAICNDAFTGPGRNIS